MQIHISMNAIWEMECKYKSILHLDIISSILGYFIFSFYTEYFVYFCILYKFCISLHV